MKKEKRKVKMKKIAMSLCSLMIVGMVPTVAFAASESPCTSPCNHAAAIGDTHYDTLGEAFSAVATGNTVTFLKIM